MDNKIKHLEMIESIIERMGNNCFQLKGWAIALVSIIGALAAKETDRRFVLVAFIPIISFWAIDSYYLQMERKYRELYKIVQTKKENEIDFGLEIDKSIIKGGKRNYLRCLISKTEMGFYAPIIAIVVILVIVLKVF